MSLADLVAPRLNTRADALTIRLTFFEHALIAGSMTTRIADFQTGLHLDAAGLGIALLGQPLGALATIFVASSIIERAGTRPVLAIGLPVLALSSLGLALAPGLAAFIALFALYGAAFAITNVAINVEADRVEAASGRIVMNSCHGVWSVGFLLAALLGTLARGIALPPGVHLAAVVPFALAFAFAFGLPMQPAPPRPHAGGPAKRVAWPTRMTLLLLGYMLASIFIENASRAWSVIFMRDTFSAPAWVDTLTLPAYLATMSIGRLLADRVVVRLGPVWVAQGAGVLALAGLVMVALAPDASWALAGFALAGLGICVNFPLTISAAARTGDRPASENVTALTLSNQFVGLGTPPLIGTLAGLFGLRSVYAALTLPVLLSFFLARHLARPRRA